MVDYLLHRIEDANALRNQTNDLVDMLVNHSIEEEEKREAEYREAQKRATELQAMAAAKESDAEQRLSTMMEGCIFTLFLSDEHKAFFTRRVTKTPALKKNFLKKIKIDEILIKIKF